MRHLNTATGIGPPAIILHGQLCFVNLQLMLDFSNIRTGDKYDRKWLAKHWGFTSFHPLAKGVFRPRGGGQIILFATKEKQTSQEPYNDYISGDRLYWEGEIGHGNDERIERAKTNGEEIHLFYRDTHVAPFEYKGRLELLSAKCLTNKPSEFIFRLATQALM